MDKNHLQGLRNLKKTIFNVLEANLAKNLIFEKKVTKFTLKYRNFRYFWNFKICLVTGNGRWPSKKSAGRCGLNFFVTKNFFDRQTQKFMILIYKNIPPPKKKRPFFFWGGGLGFDVPIIVMWLALCKKIVGLIFNKCTMNWNRQPVFSRLLVLPGMSPHVIFLF